MCADDGAVDDRAYFFDICSELAEYLRPDVLLGTVREPVVHGLPIAKSLGQVSPGQPGLRPKNHRVDEKTVTALGLPALRTPREKRL
jgi:hypothetical protein